jgi:hypothetical protein
LEGALRSLPFEPYAPVRRQYLELLRLVNKRRKAAGLAVAPFTALRLRRRSVLPFGDRLRDPQAGPLSRDSDEAA